MNQFILASHGGLSAGARDTAEMILGEVPNLYAVSTTRDETETVIQQAKRLLASFAPGDAVYILTDIKGGSVNNDMLTLLREHPGIKVICGLNMALVINLVAIPGPISAEDLAEILAVSRQEITDCSALVLNATADEEEDDL